MSDVNVRRMSVKDLSEMASGAPENFWPAVAKSLGKHPEQVTIEEMLQALPEFLRQMNDFLDDLKISVGSSLLNMEDNDE